MLGRKHLKKHNDSLLDQSKRLTLKEYRAYVADIIKRLHKDYKGKDKLYLDLSGGMPGIKARTLTGAIAENPQSEKNNPAT